MQEARPSHTALRVAMRRAAHQLYDARPLVFDDPFAVPILPPDARLELQRTPGISRKPFSVAFRTFIVCRARFVEDVLANGVGGILAERLGTRMLLSSALVLWGVLLLGLAAHLLGIDGPLCNRPR